MQNEHVSVKLGIVIPYYKSRYIKETLRSIEQQSSQQFHLYIGDDNSPCPIQEAIEELPIHFRQQVSYHRFSDNMGSLSLVKQWDRCVALSKGEPYIWLFSDDDIMPPDAVERFYDFIADHADPDVVRFNIQIIDDGGKITGKGKPHPSFETARDFIFRRFNGECLSTACEYIFSRQVYYDKGGFVEFPLAWASDDASWANFAERKGIHTLPGSPVSWRMGGHNISSDTSALYRQKIDAAILYLRYVGGKFLFPDELKLKMLFAQLSLLDNTKEVRRYFYTTLFKSQLFRQRFLLQQIGARYFNRLVRRIKRSLPGLHKKH